ncbi:MAG TPA: shikimate dehydrogenase [Motilibacteraceae bacterium]|nr:shikimate dehydrogenase [Motilibacteraceae bacterium]
MRAAVLGSPIAHSLSPVLHRAAYAELGLDWSYDSYDVTETDLPGFVSGLDGDVVGLSLTMPLKRAVIPLLDWVSPLARQVHAVNTVVLGRGRRLGANTDVPGMVAALRERGVAGAASATVVGGGATATSALAALADLGLREAAVVVRRPEAAGELVAAADRLGVRADVRAWAEGADPAAGLLARDLVISTVPGDAAAGLLPALPAAPRALFDVVYHPWPTALAAAWASAGGLVVGGLDLLVHQAVLQVGLMTGRDTAGLVEVMRAAGERALAARA